MMTIGRHQQNLGLSWPIHRIASRGLSYFRVTSSSIFNLLYTFYASSICFGIWFVWSDLGIGQREMVCSSDLFRSPEDYWRDLSWNVESSFGHEILWSKWGWDRICSNAESKYETQELECPNMSQHIVLKIWVSHNIPALSRLAPWQQ
jgi:hypothetical protein